MAPPAMASSALTQTVDFWTAQAVMASGYLVALYRILGDERQEALAMEACGPCEARARRLGLQAQIDALDAAFAAEYPEELLGEEKAWQRIVEAHAGLCAVHDLIEDPEQDPSLRGTRAGTANALRQALKGYRTAFPEECTVPGIRQAMESAARRCADGFSFTGDREEPRQRQELHDRVLEALLWEAV